MDNTPVQGSEKAGDDRQRQRALSRWDNEGGAGPDGPQTEPFSESAEAVIADLRDRWIRAEAGTANVHMRAKRELDDARLYAIQKFAADVVEGVENLRRGLDSLPPPADGDPATLTILRDSFAEIERSFLVLLKRNGVERQEEAGALFDANRHEAIAAQENHSAPPGTILHALSAGWTLNGRPLRAAMVVVAKVPPARSTFGPDD